jgi:uncharacterized protein
MSTDGEPIDGSRLCLACGLCCQGLLHHWASLRNDEVEAAQRLGLHTDVQKGEAQFSLPCPCHRDGRCTVYAERLSPCREYRCKLLRGHLAGRIPWAAALRRVEQAKRLITAIRVRLGIPEPGAGIWQQLRAADARAGVLDADVQLEVAALLTLCQRHFWNRAKPTRTFGP